jgi:hypothetical protein
MTTRTRVRRARGVRSARPLDPRRLASAVEILVLQEPANDVRVDWLTQRLEHAPTRADETTALPGIFQATTRCI